MDLRPVSLISPMSEMIIYEGRPPSPHPALFFALSHFGLRELLLIRMVCRSLRDAVDADPLLWRDLKVEAPLSWKITGSALLNMAAKADGTLLSLNLINCKKITDDALQRVAEGNPGITKLCIPGCVKVTPDGIVRVVSMLGNLKCLRLYGLLNIKQKHLDSINSLLQVNPVRPPMFYNSLLSPKPNVDDHPIDVDICPKCKDIRLVFDCPRKTCQEMLDRLLPCRGCFFCIARCEQCGGCIELEELGEGTVCSHLFCSDCWLTRPKCMLCNLPSCGQHCSVPAGANGLALFTCDRCSFVAENMFDLEKNARECSIEWEGI